MLTAHPPEDGRSAPALPWAVPLETSYPPGDIGCVDDVVAAQRTLTLRRGCSHRAAFAATYWRLTTFMRDAIAEPGFFDRLRHIAHEDVEFDEEHRRQMRAWERGDLADVTPDYEAVFAANDAGILTAQADQLATIAAHVLGRHAHFALLLFEWRELAWRKAEELRFIRVASGTGLLYRAKLAAIRAESLAVVKVIIASGRDTPAGRAMRDAYCAANRPT